jgi:hypothetical protein
MAEPLERCERELRGLLGLLGTSDAASPVFGARVDALLRCAQELESGAAALSRDPARVRRALALNALVQDAVRAEQAGVVELLRQARSLRAALAQAEGPGETGDSCDVRG